MLDSHPVHTKHVYFYVLVILITWIFHSLPNQPYFEYCINMQIQVQEKKEEIWLSPMTKAPTPTEMSKGQSDNTNNATKKLD